MRILHCSNLDVLIIDLHDFVVGDLREPVAFLELGSLPLGTIIVRLERNLLRSRSFATKRVLDVLEDDEVDRAVVDLPEILALRRVQIDDHGPAEVVVGADQVSRQLAGITLNQGLRQSLKRLVVLQVGHLHRCQLVLNVLGVQLFLEANLKDGVAATIQHFRQLGHRALDLFVEVVAAPAVSH